MGVSTIIPFIPEGGVAGHLSTSPVPGEVGSSCPAPPDSV